MILTSDIQNYWYLVYPSWADCSATWETLRFCAGSDVPPPEILQKLNPTIPLHGQARFWNGLHGGGIAEYARIPDKIWWPHVALGREANLRTPDRILHRVGMLPERPCHVQYVEPYSFDIMTGNRRRIIPLCSTAIFPVDFVEDVFWRVTVSPASILSQVSARVTDICVGFGLESTVVEGAESTMLSKRCCDAIVGTDSWIRVVPDKIGVGANYAVTLYAACELSKQLGKKLRRLDLVARISTK